MKLSLLALWAASFASAYVVNNGTECYVYPESLTHFGQPVDDTPSILHAFELCGTNGSVILTNHTFYINQVMNTTQLQNCNVSILGKLIWSSNIPYWLSHSLSVVYDNLTTAWLFGGTNVSLLGHGVGNFDGQGQLWYDENRNGSNQPGRPIAITFFKAKNLLVDGLTWRQSQFWHSFIAYSENVTMTNIFMNSTSSTSNNTVNTDGTDTWNAKNLHFANWTVQNGDDCIGVKGNSSNVYGTNITCYGSGSMPIGSVGQFAGKPDYVENVLFENVVLHDSSNAAWIKTWQGLNAANNYNGAGGGGGGGYVRNVTWRNMYMENVNQPIFVTQCIYTGDPSVCDTSDLQISDITWQNISGTSRYDVIGSIHCSAKVPCPGLKFIDVNIKPLNASKGLPSPADQFLCANIVGQNATGSNATGIPCNGFAPNNFPQQLTHNY